MASDFTRFLYNVWQDHSGVLMQQGKVMLDADWNEFVELLDRHLRAETIDIFNSHCIVPKKTIHAFEILISGTNLTIGRGRIYVDGYLAENHGGEPLEFDPGLEERRGTLPLAYDKQPYLPSGANISPIPPTGGPFLVYLDVWKREVTALQEPEMIEKAVNVDTASRYQTVWQVKCLGNVGGITCDTPDDKVPGWATLTAASAGRLTTDAVGVPSSDDPCIIPPNGGYRGTENRLYRVEIHDKGAQGTAAFKWSRDNASVASNVTALNGALDELTVVRTGRDATLRFNQGDWVEVTDDWREFAGLPGFMRKVQKVDDVKLTIKLTAALPAATFDATDATRHLRVIRWDQKGLVRDNLGNVIWDVEANNGVIQVPAGATNVVLEDGVQVTFSADPVGGSFHALDYWGFAARTADASVEKLKAAPPRGIHHHYCRLAIVSFPSSVQDCRDFWPPDFPTGGGESCDCTVCVSPESHNGGTLTLKQAVETVKSKLGGKICLQPGFYFLREPLVIDNAISLRMEGKGALTILLANTESPAILVTQSADIALHRMTVLNLGPALAALQAGALHFQDLFLWSTGNAQTPLGISALALMHCVKTRVVDCMIAQTGSTGEALGGLAIGMAGIAMETDIRDNILLGAFGVSTAAAPISDAGKGLAETFQLSLYLLTTGLTVRDNLILARLIGIHFGFLCLHLGSVALLNNSVNGAALLGIASLGVTMGQIVPASRVDVNGNVVRMLNTGTGIAVACDDTRVDANDVSRIRLGDAATAPETPADLGAEYQLLGAGFGIVLAPSLLNLLPAQDNTDKGIDRCLIGGNRITNMPFHGIYLTNWTILQSALLKQNYIENVGGGGIIMELGQGSPQPVLRVDRIVIENNQIRNVSVGNQEKSLVIAGIRIVETRWAQIANNLVARVGVDAQTNQTRSGIETEAVVQMRVAGNTVHDIGPAEFVGRSFGIRLRQPGVRADVVDNDVRRMLDKQFSTGSWWALTIEGDSPVKLGNKKVGLPRGRGMIAVRGNLLDTSGDTTAAEIRYPGVCTFSDNQCRANSKKQEPVARIEAGAVIASANYLEGPESQDLVTLDIRTPYLEGPYSVLGNITSGFVLLNGNPLPPVTPQPWEILNVREL